MFEPGLLSIIGGFIFAAVSLAVSLPIREKDPFYI